MSATLTGSALAQYIEKEYENFKGSVIEEQVPRRRYDRVNGWQVVRVFKGERGALERFLYVGATSTASARDAWFGSSADGPFQLRVGRRSDSRRSSVAGNPSVGESHLGRAFAAI